MCVLTYSPIESLSSCGVKKVQAEESGVYCRDHCRQSSIMYAGYPFLCYVAITYVYRMSGNISMSWRNSTPASLFLFWSDRRSMFNANNNDHATLAVVQRVDGAEQKNRKLYGLGVSKYWVHTAQR